MSDDIVARLRQLDEDLQDEDKIVCFKCVEEAADEIERLRTERDEAEPLLNELWERRTEATEMRAEIERLRKQVEHHARDRVEYCDAWSKWIEENDGLDIAKWCRAYADAVPYPNPDGPEIVRVIHARLDARHRMAADEIERLRFERDGFQEGNRQTLAALAEANEIAKRYKAERDEARRWCCELFPAVFFGHKSAEEQAVAQGWDCFKEAR